MSEKRLCPVCSEGDLVAREERNETEYKGRREFVPIILNMCTVCGAESAGQEESRANKRTVLRFRKAVDGLLLGEEIRAIRKQHGLTQARAAILFGGGPVAFSKYENDDVLHSGAMDSLLRLVKISEDAFNKLLHIKGMRIILRRRSISPVYRWDIDNVTCLDFDKVG